MNNVSFDDVSYSQSESHQKYLIDNSGLGTLKIKAYTANQAIPLRDVDVVITKNIDGQEIEFFAGKTDESGIIDNISLPTKKVAGQVTDESQVAYTKYDMVATYPKYNVTKKYQVSIFDGVKVIQPVKIPVTNLLVGDRK